MRQATKSIEINSLTSSSKRQFKDFIGMSARPVVGRIYFGVTVNNEIGVNHGPTDHIVGGKGRK